MDDREIRDELAIAWERGVRAWAWWNDGEQYVGTCGTSLKAALLTNPYKENTCKENKYWPLTPNPEPYPGKP